MRRLRKSIREKGKVRLSEYFKELKEGDKVAFKPSLEFPCYYHRRYRGLAGKVIGKRGKCYIVEVFKGGKRKLIITHPIHLIKLE
jgi:large subunit ribosomal protein L21e